MAFERLGGQGGADAEGGLCKGVHHGAASVITSVLDVTEGRRFR